MTAFHLTNDAADSGRVVAVHGDLDIATVPELRAELADTLASGTDCMLSLAECTFLDSSGTREIVLAAERFSAAGLRLTLYCPGSNRPVRFVVDLVGLAGVMTVEPGDASTA
jgi:anti-anti-sigma factor